MTLPEDPTPGNLVPLPPGAAMVRMVGDDHAVVVGQPEAVARFGAIRWRLPEAMMRMVRAALVAAPGVAAVAAELAGDLVQLTPQAKTLLAQHGPLAAKDGATMGVVQAADGKFAFQPAGRMAQLGPALPVLLAAMAVQAQLVAIERKLDDIQGDIDAIIRNGQIQVLAEARAALEILDDIHDDLAQTGELTDDDWERLVPLELPVRKLHQQAAAHLRDLDRLLGAQDAGVGDRLKALRRAARHDRTGFWFETYVVAETALARWDYLRLVRLAVTEDPKLAREVEQAEAALRGRRDFVLQLAHRLSGHLANAGRVDGLLQRMRIIAQARLEKIILDLDGMLAAYRQWTPPVTGDEGPAPASALPAGAGPLPVPAEDPMWTGLVDQVRGHSGSMARRAGVLVGRATVVVSGTARTAVAKAGEVSGRIRQSGDDASGDDPARVHTDEPGEDLP